MTDGTLWQVLGTTISAASFIGLIIGGAIGYGRLKSRAEAAETKADKALAETQKLSADQAAFRELAAKEFVSMTTLDKLEERVIGAIDRLGDRLDRLFESRKRE